MVNWKDLGTLALIWSIEFGAVTLAVKTYLDYQVKAICEPLAYTVNLLTDNTQVTNRDASSRPTSQPENYRKAE